MLGIGGPDGRQRFGDFLRADRTDIQIGLLSIRQELRIAVDVLERLLKRLGAIGRNAGRRRERPRKFERRLGELDQRKRRWIRRKLARRRHILQVRGASLPAELQQHLVAAVRLEPVRLDRLDPRKIDHAPLHFAALRCQKQSGAAAISGNHLDVQAKRVMQENRDVVAVRARRGTPEHNRRPTRSARFFDRLVRSIGPDHEHIGIIGEARRRTKPGQLFGIELDAGIAAEDGTNRHGRREHRDGGAVLRCHIINVVGRAKASRTRHILHDDRRVARNEAAEMAREHPGIDVVTAPTPVTDNNRDLLALVKVLNGIRTSM